MQWKDYKDVYQTWESWEYVEDCEVLDVFYKKYPGKLGESTHRGKSSGIRCH